MRIYAFSVSEMMETKEFFSIRNVLVNSFGHYKYNNSFNVGNLKICRQRV